MSLSKYDSASATGCDMEQQISIMSENDYVSHFESMTGGELFPALGESTTVHLHFPGYIRSVWSQLYRRICIAVVGCSLYMLWVERYGNVLQEKKPRESSNKTI